MIEVKNDIVEPGSGAVSSKKISLFLYPIFVGDVAPHYTIQKAFEKYFDCTTYDWVNIAKKKGLHQTQMEFLEWLKQHKPEYCFMQLQNPVNMSVPVVREMAKHTRIINWSGDIRQSKNWYDWFTDIGREIHLTLFSNNTDVDILRERGVRADYLQVGFDSGWYDRKENTGLEFCLTLKIIFLCCQTIQIFMTMC